MRKALLLTVVLSLVVGASAFAEIELGVGLAPSIGEIPEEARGDFFSDSTKVVHAGYSFWWLFYISYDGLILPPYAVSSLTGGVDIETGDTIPGYYVPGFLNTFNVGLRPTLGPISLFLTMGPNTMYLYREGENDYEKPELGVNLKFGAGLRFAKFIGFTFTGMSIFDSFESLVKTLEGVASDDSKVQQRAIDRIMENLFPAITLNLYL